MRRFAIVLSALIVLGFVSPFAVGQTAAELLSIAESAVNRAEETQDPAQRTALYDEAIAGYRGVLETGVENASIYRNIGTVFVLKGDAGRAIVNFRRADRLDPTDARVAESLEAARGMVRSAVPSGVRTRAMKTVFFWRGLISRNVLLWIGLGGWIVVWLGAAIRLGGSRRGVGLGAAGAIVCVLAVGSLAGERVFVSMNASGVVVDDGTVGYRGPSEGVYEPTFAEPIRAGVEGSIVERRDGWVRLRLRSGAETWVREAWIEVV